MYQVIIVFKFIVFLSVLSSCKQNAKTEQEMIDEIDALDVKWSKRPLKRTMHLSHYYGAEGTVLDTTYHIGDYEKTPDRRRYQINCSTNDSRVNVIFLLDSNDVVKRSLYFPKKDSFQVIHLIDAPQWAFNYTTNQLNPDTIPFLIAEDKALIKRLLNLK